MMSYFFYLVIPQRGFRLLVVILLLLFIVFFLINFKTDNDHYNATIPVVGFIFILFLCLCYLSSVLKPSSDEVNILKPAFLIVIAFIISISCTLFLNIISNRFALKEMEKYWSLSNYTGILDNLIFSSAFLLFYRQQKSKPPENHIVDYTSPSDR
jgi:drug/metabolite transporter (DMT)-like permease